ncbi:MAG: class I SAM-dependent methyltransferase [Deltaproteobacteria bacterium]|nr:class I SAM-dependent methyltransferase [Deltaproteobacteria bacterium]
MATNTKAVERDVTSVEISMDGPPFANILWRWIGVRAVPHLPCKFDCPDSIRTGKDMLALGRKIGCGEEMDWIEEILNWPVEWSALHGVAEILTPVVKVSTTTDSTGAIHTVRWKGRSFPREGAQGLRFPYSSPPKKQRKASAPRRLDNRESIRQPSATILPEWYNRDNGFATRFAMDRAHDPIVKLAIATLGNAGGSILDLGCGNGALLAKIVNQVPGAIPFGIDLNASAVEHASEVLPTFNGNISVGNLFDADRWAADRRYELVILMVGRLREAPPDSAKLVVDALIRCASNTLVYVYSGWSPESLSTIVARAGLRLAQPSGKNCGLLDLN